MDAIADPLIMQHDSACVAMYRPTVYHIFILQNTFVTFVTYYWVIQLFDILH